MIYAVFNSSLYPLKNLVILDSGTTLYIFNEISRFLNFRPVPKGDYVFAGDSQVPILGYSNIDIKVSSLKGPKIMRLHDVTLYEDFIYNLVSLRLFRRRGYWWNNKGSNNYLKKKDDLIVYKLIKRFD